MIARPRCAPIVTAATAAPQPLDPSAEAEEAAPGNSTDAWPAAVARGIAAFVEGNANAASRTLAWHATTAAMAALARARRLHAMVLEGNEAQDGPEARWGQATRPQA
mmetsp:Transcript_242/g.541  ORF Transcript_242/g.541 Transcript_242/m.541 type:complete len:107 (-) Transcript_242:8-328(-)